MSTLRGDLWLAAHGSPSVIEIDRAAQIAENYYARLIGLCQNLVDEAPEYLIFHTGAIREELTVMEEM